jgi:hypothetical protein
MTGCRSFDSAGIGIGAIAGIHRSRAKILFLIGRNDEALAAARRALAITVRQGDRAAAAGCRILVSDIHAVTGDYRLMRSEVEAALLLFREAGGTRY